VSEASQEAENARRALVDEYKETGINWRFYGEVRFKQLTVFLTAMAAFGASAFSQIVRNLIPAHRAGIALLAIAVVVAFFVLEERATFYRRAYMRTALDLEDQLGFHQYADAKNSPRWKSRFVFRTIFAGITGTWLAFGAWAYWPGNPWTAISAGIPFGLLALCWRRLEKYQNCAGETALLRLAARCERRLASTAATLSPKNKEIKEQQREHSDGAT